MILSVVYCAEADAAKAESASNLVCLLVNIYIKLLDLGLLRSRDPAG